MGYASEVARASVEDGSRPSDALLNEYSVTPSMSHPLRTPRTPAEQDTILTVSIHNQSKTILQSVNQSINQ